MTESILRILFILLIAIIIVAIGYLILTKRFKARQKFQLLQQEDPENPTLKSIGQLYKVARGISIVSLLLIGILLIPGLTDTAEKSTLARVIILVGILLDVSIRYIADTKTLRINDKSQ